MGEFLAWSILTIFVLFIIMIIALIDTKQDVLKPVFSFIVGFLSSFLIILMAFGCIYYFNLI